MNVYPQPWPAQIQLLFFSRAGIFLLHSLFVFIFHNIPYICTVTCWGTYSGGDSQEEIGLLEIFPTL